MEKWGESHEIQTGTNWHVSHLKGDGLQKKRCAAENAPNVEANASKYNDYADDDDSFNR